MGCKNSNLKILPCNKILFVTDTKFSKVRKALISYRNKQKINSYSLFFVNSAGLSPSKHNKFDNFQLLLVDDETYYSSLLPKVWLLYLIVNKNKSSKYVIKITTERCNTRIFKQYLSEFILNKN